MPQTSLLGTPLAIVGTVLTIVGYVGRVLTEPTTLGIIVGMMIITTGYALLLLGYMKRLKDESGLEDGTDKDRPKEWKSRDVLQWGSIVLFTFFTLIFILPSLTYTVQYYDPFAAFGYGLAGIFAHGIPPVIPYALLTLYYTLGSYQKLKENGWIMKLQLVSRSILAIFYGLSAFLSQGF